MRFDLHKTNRTIPLEGICQTPFIWFPLIIIALWGPDHAKALEIPTQLPQNHPYQIVLRDHLATLEEKDFEIDLKPITFNASGFESPDELYPVWFLFEGRGRADGMPGSACLRIPASSFTLATLEGEKGVRFPFIPRSAASVFNAWWHQWNYPGNPYFRDEAVRNRALAAAAVDMIMSDWYLDHPEGSRARRSDYIGGMLFKAAYTYGMIKNSLPKNVQEAFEMGLRRFVDRMIKLGPDRRNDNMNVKGIVALWYTSQAANDPILAEKAKNQARKIAETVFHPSGMIYDAGGLDDSYNGIALYFLSYAALATKWDFLWTLNATAHRLKTHLILPEPDGLTYLSPNHYSVRSDRGAASDQWGPPHRDLAAAMTTDEALCLLWGGRRDRHDSRYWVNVDFTPKNEAKMRQDIANNLARYVNQDITTPVEADLQIWRENHWPSTPNFAHDHYVPGFHKRIISLEEANSPLCELPVSRGETYIRSFSDTFIAARFPNYATIIYTGPIGWHSYFNQAGGALSAFWTPKSGSVILGATWNKPKAGTHGWPQWRELPSHAVSGCSQNKAFSSSRIRRRMLETNHEMGPNEAHITVSGPMGANVDSGRAVQDGALQGGAVYSRRFSLTAEGLEILTSLTADGMDTVTELYEIIPIFLRHPKTQSYPHENNKYRKTMKPAAISFKVGGDWVPASTNDVHKVEAIKIIRFDGGAVISLDRPRTVKLSKPWESRVQTRNVLIDLLETETTEEGIPLRNAPIKYSIRPMEPTAHNELSSQSPSASLGLFVKPFPLPRAGTLTAGGGG